MGARVKFTHEPHFLAIVFELVVKAIEVSGVCLSAGAKRQHLYKTSTRQNPKLKKLLPITNICAIL